MEACVLGPLYTWVQGCLAFYESWCREQCATGVAVRRYYGARTRGQAATEPRLASFYAHGAADGWLRARLDARSFEGLRPLGLAALSGAGAASAVHAVQRLQSRHADLPAPRLPQTATAPASAIASCLASEGCQTFSSLKVGTAVTLLPESKTFCRTDGEMINVAFHSLKGSAIGFDHPRSMLGKELEAR